VLKTVERFCSWLFLATVASLGVPPPAPRMSFGLALSPSLGEGERCEVRVTTLADFRAGPRPPELIARGMGELVPLDLGS
jgi:hypothetical protein